jgi:hypothetical protein
MQFAGSLADAYCAERLRLRKLDGLEYLTFALSGIVYSFSNYWLSLRAMPSKAAQPSKYNKKNSEMKARFHVAGHAH